MNKIGFPIAHKDGEKRRALLPQDIMMSVQHPEALYFETGYGLSLDIDDEEYIQAGANIASREEILAMPIICDAKMGDADYLDQMHGQILFGWIHAVQNRDITDAIVNGGNTAYAWEDMYEADGIHSFYRNNQIAGRAATLHAFRSVGKSVVGAKVAVLGRGNCATGAMEYLGESGAVSTQYVRGQEADLVKDLPKYDAVINAIKWDTTRKDHIIYRKDLDRMRKDSILIDISCDRAGAIETSVPTSISDPIYKLKGVWHYAVDNTPSLLYREASEEISAVVAQYIDELIEGLPGPVLEAARIIDHGTIIDQRINEFQGRK